MFFLLVFIFAGTATLGAIQDFSRSDYGSASTVTNVESFRQELFTLAAERYMAKFPSTTGDLAWSQIKTAMPPSFTTGAYSNQFKLRVIAPQKFITCGQLKNDAAVTVAMQRQSNLVTKPLGNGFFASATDQQTLNNHASTCRG